MTDLRRLTWSDFERARAAIAHHVRTTARHPLEGVYGLPRGGLTLAVALSHDLGIPLLPRLEPWSLIVDDIYETGRTLAPMRGLSGAVFATWVSREPLDWCYSPEVVTDGSWLVFPWENPFAAQQDREAYYASRQ